MADKVTSDDIKALLEEYHRIDNDLSNAVNKIEKLRNDIVAAVNAASISQGRSDGKVTLDPMLSRDLKVQLANAALSYSQKSQSISTIYGFSQHFKAQAGDYYTKLAPLKNRLLLFFRSRTAADSYASLRTLCNSYDEKIRKAVNEILFPVKKTQPDVIYIFDENPKQIQNSIDSVCPGQVLIPEDLQQNSVSPQPSSSPLNIIKPNLAEKSPDQIKQPPETGTDILTDQTLNSSLKVNNRVIYDGYGQGIIMYQTSDKSGVLFYDGTKLLIPTEKLKKVSDTISKDTPPNDDPPVFIKKHSSNDYSVGSEITHTKYGKGEIISVNVQYLTVEFADGKIRTIMKSELQEDSDNQNRLDTSKLLDTLVICSICGEKLIRKRMNVPLYTSANQFHSLYAAVVPFCTHCDHAFFTPEFLEEATRKINEKREATEKLYIHTANAVFQGDRSTSYLYLPISKQSVVGRNIKRIDSLRNDEVVVDWSKWSRGNSTVNRNSSSSDFGNTLNAESFLKQLGYSTQISTSARHDILREAVHETSKRKVIDHLQFLINLRLRQDNGAEKYQRAISIWKDDIEYVLHL